MNESPPFLEIRGLVKRYESVVAIEHVDLSIARNEFLTLLGPSGSGKTTILMAIAGFVKPTEGQILLNGRDLVPLEPEERELGVVFQGYALFPHMTVAQNVAFPLELRKQPRDAIRRRVKEVLALVDLERFALRRPAQLSGGQQQRVALARCLAYSPDLLLLDEPLSALDRQLRQRLQTELKTLHRKVGVTIINVTHDQEEALSMSTRIAVINHGRIVQLGTPTEIYDHPVTSFVAQFIGRSNVLEVERAETAGGMPVAVVAGRRLPAGWIGAAGGKKAYSIRPEHIDVLPAGALPGGASDDLQVVLEGRIEDLVYQGSMTLLDVQTPIGLMRAELSTSRLAFEPEIGADVVLRWESVRGRIVDADELVVV